MNVHTYLQITQYLERELKLVGDDESDASDPAMFLTYRGHLEGLAHASFAVQYDIAVQPDGAVRVTRYAYDADIEEEIAKPLHLASLAELKADLGKLALGEAAGA